MKANEAPEKIYRTTTYLDNNRGKIVWKAIPVKGTENVEYTRTDAFIEKACSWLKDCATFTDMNGKKRIDEEMYKATVEDFKTYMEGE